HKMALLRTTPFALIYDAVVQVVFNVINYLHRLHPLGGDLLQHSHQFKLGVSLNHKHLAPLAQQFCIAKERKASLGQDKEAGAVLKREHKAVASQEARCANGFAYKLFKQS